MHACGCACALVSCLKAISLGHGIKLVFTTKDTVGNDMTYVNELFCCHFSVKSPGPQSMCLLSCHWPNATPLNSMGDSGFGKDGL